MKQKRCLLGLIALAAAASASAQSSVTLYGLVDEGIVHQSGGPYGTSRTIMTGGVQSGSRVGFKGSEDLGSGFAAIYTLEMGINADDGTITQGGAAFGRQSWVGLKSPYGTVMLGKQYTPVAIVQADTDPFGTGLAGTSANLLTAGGAQGNNRMPDTARYTFAGESGFTADLAYGFGEVVDSMSANRQYGGSVGYVSGPAYVKLAYQNVNDAKSVSGSATFLGARYDFKVATAFFNYVINRGSAVFGLVNADAHDVLVGVSVPYGVHQFMLSYIHKDDRTMANNDANQVAFGYLYFLSKRTNLYYSIARIDNNAPATSKTGFYRVGNATDQGIGSHAYNFGIRHLF